MPFDYKQEALKDLMRQIEEGRLQESDLMTQLEQKPSDQEASDAISRFLASQDPKEAVPPVQPGPPMEQPSAQRDLNVLEKPFYEGLEERKRQERELEEYFKNR